MMSIISVKNLRKEFKNGDNNIEVLKGVNLEINEGEITTILGPSGSGKTTTLNIISGLESATEGTIEVDGQIITELKDKELINFRREKVGFIFQQYNLVHDLTVRENIELVASLVDNPMDINDVMSKVGIIEHSEKFPYQLSGGQQQRVAIARAVIKNPRILFCDEPTGALDETTGKEILELLKNLNDLGSTLLMITHNKGIGQMSHNIVKFNSGKVVSMEQNTKLVDPKDVEWS